MRERDIEKYLREQVKSVGGKAYKWTSPGNNGVPDRIVLLPGGKVVFVELKAPGKMLTALQINQHKQLRELGCWVLTIDSKDQVDSLVEAYRDGVLDYYLGEMET